METYGYIYITTNQINNKRYIGKYKSKDWDYSYFGSGKLLGYAIKKYGLENFTCFPLAWAWNEDELNQLEISYIEHYKPEYNIAKGGHGGNLGEKVNKKISEKLKGKVHTEEHKRKISESNKGKKRKTFTEEHKRKLSEKCKGEKNGMFGKNHTEKTRLKLIESAKGENNPMFGRKHSEGTKLKISIARKKYFENKKIA
jgi:group I intron endonuclease